MELKKVNIVNRGMLQDYSISKSSQEFAFENYNIRIVTNDDCTSMSITNIQGPKLVSNINDIQGIIIGKCILDKYIVLFTHAQDSTDRIYRIDLNINNITCNLLFEGYLNFAFNYLIDTTYFIENSNVIKVYWVDGRNNPRFINIITKEETLGGNCTKYTDGSVFDFYPIINQTPSIALKKSFEYDSLLLNGVILYFISYYNDNGAETLIANSSNPITIDYEDRGAKADDPQGACSIELTISNMDTTFDNIRVYSATRSSKYGEVNTKIVANCKTLEAPLTIIDNGTNQEAISFEQLLYCGGLVLIAKTLAQKDGTLFLGNLQKNNAQIPEEIYNLIYNIVKEENDNRDIFDSAGDIINSPFVKFKQNKKIPSFERNKSVHYPYFRLVKNDFSKYKTFKSGEIYRFGLLFQTNKGEWTEVVWIGDVYCDKRPLVDNLGNIILNNAECKQLNYNVTNKLHNIGISNYRLVIADPEKHNGRKIKALGVLCPTVFNSKNRYLNKFNNASWIMRPRNNKASYHHLEPLVDYTSDGAEIVTNYTNEYPNATILTKLTEQSTDNDNTYIGITYATNVAERKVNIRIVEFTTNRIETNTFDIFGESDIDVKKELSLECDLDLKLLLAKKDDEEWGKIITGLIDNNKIPTNAFVELYNKWVKDFLTSLAIGLASVILVAISGPLGAAAGGALSANAILSALGISGTSFAVGSIATTVITSLLGAAGVASLGIMDLTTNIEYTHNLSPKQLQELLQDQYDSTPDYIKELMQKGVMLMPLPSNSVLNWDESVSAKIDKIFAKNFGEFYYPIIHENGEEKVQNIKVWLLPKELKPDDLTNTDYVFFQCILKYPTIKQSIDLRDNYFVDESLLTMHSPEINEDSILNKNYKCNIIGYVPLDNNNYFDAQIEVAPNPYGEYGGINQTFINSINNDMLNYNPVYSGYYYTDTDPTTGNTYVNYKCYLFGPGDIVGTHKENSNEVSPVHSKLVKKQTINHSYSTNSVYFDKDLVVGYDSNVQLFKESPLYYERDFNTETTSLLYEGNYKNAFIVKEMLHLTSDSNSEPSTSDEMINISFNSTPHALIGFNSPEDKKDRIPLLPILNDKDNLYLSIRDNRLSPENKWSHNVLEGDRTLFWNKDLSTLTDDLLFTLFFYYMENPSINVVFPEAKNFFKEQYNSNKGQYTKIKALSVDYLLANTMILDENELNLSPENFQAKLQNAIPNNINSAALLYYYLNPGFFDSYSEFFKFVCSVCRGITPTYKEGDYYKPYNYIHTYFILGLLYFFNTELLIPLKDGGYKKYVIPPIIAKNEEFNTICTEFRECFIKLYKYSSLYKTINNLTDASLEDYKELYKKNIALKIQELYSDIKTLIAAIETIYNIPTDTLSKAYNKYLEDGDNEAWLAVQSLYSFSTDYTLNNTISGLLPLWYYLEKDGDIPINHGVDYFMKTTYEGLKSGVKDFILSSKDNKETNSMLKRFKVESPVVYEIDNNFELQDGYNGTEPLKSENILYNYNKVSGRFEKAENLEIDLYYQDLINVDPPKKPYLMLAELYNDIPYNSLYGGHTKEALLNLTWYPVSKTYSIYEAITETFGDTVYQRYDCLKTYPSTEEDINLNVDITSFMVESHINLDDRVDLNRGKFNIMTRPLNFNLFNSVYNSNNDLFAYNVKTSEFITDSYPNQFVWSLSKNYLGDVDTWTNISFAAVNQCKYPITKLCTYKDKLISFNTGSIEYIDFNVKSLVAADNGFIELLNNNKVTGTLKISDTLGTNNSSIQITEKGVYFIEDNEASLIRLNPDGSIFRVGIGALENWFKKNIKLGVYNHNNKDAVHLEYDHLNKELHIINKNYCLVYNETLEAFTSFIDFQNTSFMFNFNNKTYAFDNNNKLYLLYEGRYNTTYGDLYINYSLHYRVNPEIALDKVFTNIDFTADVGVNDKNKYKNNHSPFDFILVWNEYQDTGKSPLVFDRHSVSSLKLKFRTWRADIPRDARSKYKRDRIRNPWIHLLLSKEFNSNNYLDIKIEIHDLNVLYMA